MKNIENVNDMANYSNLQYYNRYDVIELVKI